MVVSRLEKDEDHRPMTDWPLSQNPNLQIQFLGRHAFEHLSSSEINQKKGP
jgi:hypothetical protein